MTNTTTPGESAVCVDSLLAEIMNLPARLPNEVMTDRMRDLYQRGHRDARHAAAELVLAWQERIDALRRALEMIAVGDSTNPAWDATDELVALGYWNAEAVAAMKKEPRNAD